MRLGRLFFRIIEDGDGWWACRRGRAEIDRHPGIDEALAHITQIAGQHRPSQVFIHHVDGRVLPAIELD
jgi:hypothetical protein